MPETRVIIFDLDNTLVMNRPAAKAAYESAIRFLAKEAKLEFDKLYNHWKKDVQSITSSEYAPEKRIFEYSLSNICEHHRINPKLISPTVTIYEKELLSSIKPVPGAKELVSWIKEEGGTVAVASNSIRSLTKKKLKSCDLYKYIDTIVTASDIGSMKPHPGFYQSILELHHINPKQALVIGDSKKDDLDPAKKLGIATIELAHTNPHLTELKPAIAEFLSYVK